MYITKANLATDTSIQQHRCKRATATETISSGNFKHQTLWAQDGLTSGTLPSPHLAYIQLGSIKLLQLVLPLLSTGQAARGQGKGRTKGAGHGRAGQQNKGQGVGQGTGQGKQYAGPNQAAYLQSVFPGWTEWPCCRCGTAWRLQP